MELAGAPPGGEQSKGANLPQLYGQPTEALYGLQSCSGNCPNEINCLWYIHVKLQINLQMFNSRC